VAAALIAALSGGGRAFAPLSHFAGLRSHVGAQRRPQRVTLRQALTEADVKVGGKVQVLYEGVWYDTEVLDVGDGAIKARYDDGGDEEEDIDFSTRVRPVPEPLNLKKGSRMQVEYEGVWYDCDILEVSKDGETCTARYDDGGDEEPDVDVASRIRAPPLRLSELKVGQKFRGEVVGTPPFGCFVRIGAERDGLVHISKMSRDRVDSVEDFVMQGQMVDVWVTNVDVDSEKLGLTMVEGFTGGGRQPQDLSPFEGLPSDEWFDGVVVNTAPFGAFVKVTLPSGEAADGMVHISQLRDGFVDNVDDEVSPGQSVQVRVQSVENNRMSLSMKEGGFGGGGGGRPAPVDVTPFESVSQDEWLDGKVERIAPFGAFVAVTAPGTDCTATGLVHITKIRDGFIESVEEELEVGQTVQVRIESVETMSNKLGLTMVGDSGDQY